MGEDLAVFMSARLEEIEHDAREAAGPTDGKWWHQTIETADGMASWTAQITAAEGRVALLSDVGMLAGAHIGRHSPRQVLTDIAAKHRLLSLHESAERGGQVMLDPRTRSRTFGHSVAVCLTCGPREWPEIDGRMGREHGNAPYAEDDGEPTFWPCATLRALALPFFDHPAYRPEWGP